MASTEIHYVAADGVNIFYRSAGLPISPVLLLLHGYPSSSHQYRNLIPLLAQKYRVIAPDFPGFGFTTVPPERAYKYTFDSLATTTAAFLDALSITSFSVYIFDYGSPVLFRLALKRPDAIKAIITQNGNAYVEGLGAAWAPLQAWWKEDRLSTHREGVRAALLNLEATKWQYVTGSPNPNTIQPESYTLDASFLERKDIQEIQLDLFYDYQNNIALYPQFQEYLRQSGVPVLVAWGNGDLFFIPAGAEAFRKDVKDVEVHLIDASHFALETNEAWYADLILGFLGKRSL